MADAIDIETTRGDTGGYQESDLASSHLHDGSIASRWQHVCVKDCGRVPLCIERSGQAVGATFVAEKMIALVTVVSVRSGVKDSSYAVRCPPGAAVARFYRE
jgi:hypothetical protein